MAKLLLVKLKNHFILIIMSGRLTNYMSNKNQCTLDSRNTITAAI